MLCIKKNSANDNCFAQTCRLSLSDESALSLFPSDLRRVETGVVSNDIVGRPILDYRHFLLVCSGESMMPASLEKRSLMGPFPPLFVLQNMC